jgi:biotin--protein ligase
VILIYNDKGASLVCVQALVDFLSTKHDVKCVCGDDLQKKEWMQNTRALIIPGGRSLPFYDTLGSRGNQHIREFVEQGGTYVGICAGAYYACAETIFAQGLPLELTLPGELHFFSGRAIGPVFADEDFTYDSEKGARVVTVQWQNNAIYPAYFNGGCYFDNGDSKTSVLATYADNQKPAIIVCSVGAGRAILSGVHPELSYDSIPSDSDPHHQYLRNQLLLKNNDRIQLLSQLFNFI